MAPSLLNVVKAVQAAMSGMDMTKLPHGGLDPTWFEPDAEFDLGQMALPDEAVWRGREGIVEGWQRWLAQWDGYRVTGSDLEPYGDDRVIANIHAEARGRGSGAPIAIDHVQVLTARNGRILRIDVYENRAEALEALSRAAPGDAGAAGTPPAR